MLTKRFGMQSIIKILGLISLTKSTTEGSILPEPLNPKFMRGLSIFLPKIEVQAIPGLDAQAPWAIDVP